MHFLEFSLHDSIYEYWAVRLWELHIRMIYIKNERNVIADSLFKIIFFKKNCEKNNTV